MIYHWARELSQDTAIGELNISNKTAINWYNLCRDVCHDDVFNRSEKSGGPGIIVEIDESAFGKRKYERGRLTAVKSVFGDLERGTGKCFMVHVERRNAKTLLPLIRNGLRLAATSCMIDVVHYNDIHLLPEHYIHSTMISTCYLIIIPIVQ